MSSQKSFAQAAQQAASRLALSEVVSFLNYNFGPTFYSTPANYLLPAPLTGEMLLTDVIDKCPHLAQHGVTVAVLSSAIARCSSLALLPAHASEPASACVRVCNAPEGSEERKRDTMAFAWFLDQLCETVNLCDVVDLYQFPSDPSVLAVPISCFAALPRCRANGWSLRFIAAVIDSCHPCQYVVSDYAMLTKSSLRKLNTAVRYPLVDASTPARQPALSADAGSDADTHAYGSGSGSGSGSLTAVLGALEPLPAGLTDVWAERTPVTIPAVVSMDAYNSFTVLSWNILPEYQYHPASSAIPWSVRLPTILRFILFHAPDVVMLQAVQSCCPGGDAPDLSDDNHARLINAALAEHGYFGDWAVPASGRSTVMILFKRSRFHLTGTLQPVKRQAHDKCRRLTMLLECAVSGQGVSVTNMQVRCGAEPGRGPELAAPTPEQVEDVRFGVDGCCEAASHFASLRGPSQPLACVIGGDIHSLPCAQEITSPPSRSPLEFVSSYAVVCGQEPAFTVISSKTGIKTSDFLFHNSNSCVCARVWPVPVWPKLLFPSPPHLPNQHLPSSHIPLLATYLIS